jgi:hypothetical protein
LSIDGHVPLSYSGPRQEASGILIRLDDEVHHRNLGPSKFARSHVDNPFDGIGGLWSPSAVGVSRRIGKHRLRSRRHWAPCIAAISGTMQNVR